MGPKDSELADFPNTVGSRFVYFYFDSLSMSSDTIVASIVATVPFDDAKQEGEMWEYRWSSEVDTVLVYRSGNVVLIYGELAYRWLNRKYVFPLEVGKGWGDDWYSDTSLVVDAVSIFLPRWEFATAYFIDRTWGGLNAYEHTRTWFVPKVGAVKTHHEGLSFVLANETWELIEYEIVCQE
jgi:hypothetical protein